MIVTAVTVYVKEEHVREFVAATMKNHLGSVQEPGNLRFDVLQSAADAGRFLLYEAYESGEAARAHKETPHYKEWKQAVEGWMARPREGVPFRVIAPRERQSW